MEKSEVRISKFDSKKEQFSRFSNLNQISDPDGYRILGAGNLNLWYVDGLNGIFLELAEDLCVRIVTLEEWNVIRTWIENNEPVLDSSYVEYLIEEESLYDSWEEAVESMPVTQYSSIGDVMDYLEQTSGFIK